MYVMTCPAFPFTILGTVVNKKARYTLRRQVQLQEQLVYRCGRQGEGRHGCTRVWSCGHVVMWSCGHVVMWSCGHVVMWSCSHAHCTGRQGEGRQACGCTHVSSQRPERFQTRVHTCTNSSLGGQEVHCSCGTQPGAVCSKTAHAAQLSAAILGVIQLCAVVASSGQPLPSLLEYLLGHCMLAGCVCLQRLHNTQAVWSLYTCSRCCCTAAPLHHHATPHAI